MKKIVVITAPRNENDLIESFCRYSLTYCDSVYVYDNFCIDNTMEIVEKMAEEGLSVVPVENRPEYWEDKIYYTDPRFEISKEIFDRKEADLILCFDPDEFLYCADGTNPREVLEQQDEGVEHRYPWVTYIYDKEPNDNSQFLPSNFSSYRPQSENFEFKTSISRNIYENYHGVHFFTPAVHALGYPEGISPAPIQISNKLLLGHFPVRTIAQCTAKYATGQLRIISRPGESSFFGWEKAYNILKERGTFTEKDLHDISMRYNLLDEQMPNYIPETGTFPTKNFSDELVLKYTDYHPANLNAFIIVQILDRAEVIIRQLLERELRASSTEHQELLQLLNTKQRIVSLETQLQTYRQALERSLQDAMDLKTIYESTINSTSWKIGQFFTKPFGWLKRK